MAISDAEKVDFLWKKVLYGVSKTAGSMVKFASNETISSPLAIRSSNIWVESGVIPPVPPVASTTKVSRRYGSSRIRMTSDPNSPANTTWLATDTYGNTATTLGDFIPPSFGADYAVRVYIGDPNSGNAARIYADTTNEEWVFDYTSGVLYFVNNIPSSKAATMGAGTFSVSVDGIYIEVFRYTGTKDVNRVHIVANIAERNALTPKTGDLVHVLDASAIPTDASAGEHATYLWMGSAYKIVASQDLFNIKGALAAEVTARINADNALVAKSGSTMTGDLVMNGTARFLANTGTASSPSIGFHGETQTGFRNTVGALYVTKQGTDRLAVSSNGTAIAGTLTIGNSVSDASQVSIIGEGGIVKIDSGSAFILPSGGVAARPFPAQAGMIRFNSQTSRLEFFNGSTWVVYGTPKDTVVSALYTASDMFAILNAQDGEQSFTYDVNGNILSKVNTFSGTTITTTYSYTIGRLVSLSATDGINTWVKSFTYTTNGEIASISAWVQQ